MTSKNDNPMSPMTRNIQPRVGPVGPASALRCVAGLPAGWEPGGRTVHPGARRGATLILIIGALALLSVVTLAYFLIGKADRRTAAVTSRKFNIEQNVDRIGEYIATDIIGADVLSAFSEGEDPANGFAYLMREAWDYPYTDWSRLSQPVANQAAAPAQYDRERFDPRGTIPRSFVSVEASPQKNKLLPFPGSDPWLASSTPTWLNPAPNAPRYDQASDSWVGNGRDWAQISNIAPDGRFVNLFNIRNNFNAEPGFTPGPGGSRTSDNLSLQLDNGDTTLNLDIGIPSDKNRPAHWGTRQRRAFRPVGSAGFGFADPENPMYQWADTDGDGFFDARFQELDDATDPNNIVSLLPSDGRFRWFVAARIVDLSGKLNVNVATDTRPSPLDAPNPGVTNAHRAGASPSDLDLRSMLTLQDAFRLYSAGGYLGGYSQLPAGTGLEDYTTYDNLPAAAVGAYGYNGIGATIGLVQTPGGNQDLRTLPTLRAQERFDYYRFNGGFAPGDAGFDLATTSATLTGLFGVPDLIELMTYRGINDPANRSRLELAVGGRDYQNDEQFSPLRDNRSLATERNWAAGVDPYGQLNPGTPEGRAALLWSALDIRQHLTTLSGARPLRSQRIAYEPATWTELLLSANQLGRNFIGSGEEMVDAVAALQTAAGDPAVTQRDPHFLFRGYADALLPMSADLYAWYQAPPYNTLAYGHNPETALRITGTVTANQVDLYDENSIPSAYTLLLDGSAAARAAIPVLTLPTGERAFPWWSEPNFSGQLDLDAELARNDPTFGSQIEPYGANILRDQARLSANDGPNAVTAPALNVFGIEAQPFVTEVATFHMYTDAPAGAGGDNDHSPPGGLVTIAGDVATSNANFIFQCVAFQLNNPFDEPIILTDNFYIEFGLLTTANDSELNIIQRNADGSLTPVTLQPRETKVFYILSQPPAQIVARMKAVEPTIDDIADPDTDLDLWIRNQLDIQFSSANGAIRMPNAKGPLQPVNVRPLLAGDPGDDNPENRVFRLWRVMRSQVDSGGPNNTTNDLLADRLRDPDTVTRPTLDRRLGLGQNFVNGAIISNGEGNSPDGGLSITLWASIRRPDDPKDDLGRVPRGALPAWCVERKFDNIGQLSMNDAADAGVTVNALQLSHFSGTPGGDTFLELMADQATGGVVTNLIPSLQTQSEVKTGYSIDLIAGAQQDGLGYASLYPEAHLENDRFMINGRSVLRVGDMLLALAVGPSQNPFALDDAASRVGDDRWTTLGESLAMALGYNNPPNDAAHAPIYNLYGKTDRGALRLDAFVPFVNNSGGPPDFDAGVDKRRGLGIPLALGVLDVFNALEPQFGSIGRPTIGVVNLNNAPEPVLRAVPMLAPAADNDPLGNPQWWWSGGPLNSQADIVSTLIAYRDKTRLLPRGETTDDLSFVGATSLIPGYYNEDPAAPIIELYGRDSSVPNSSPTGIDGIREHPGLMSRGEIMAVRDRLQVSPNAPFSSVHSIDRLGRDYAGGGADDSVIREGVESVRYTGLDDQIQDDYDEKLAIANGMLNTVSVRSDLFAATFIVHGYQKSDCEGLTPRDPLVPSVARRYLMIVDRSNVARSGDRPRILVFKELPIR